MGDAQSGKTSLILRWLRGSFQPIERGTFMEDIYHRTIIYQQLLNKEMEGRSGIGNGNGNDNRDTAEADADDEKDLKRFSALDVQFLDSESMGMTYDNSGIRTAQIKQSDAFILCFDPTNRETFEDLDSYYHRIQEIMDDAVIIICSTKCDMYMEAEVKPEEVSELLTKLDLSMEDDFIEVSAKTGINTTTLLCKVLRKISQHKKIARRAYRRAKKEQSHDGYLRDITPSTTSLTSSLPSELSEDKKNKQRQQEQDQEQKQKQDQEQDQDQKAPATTSVKARSLRQVQSTEKHLDQQDEAKSKASCCVIC